MKRQQGFTLIELIVVIVILGILAATAVPKFVNLQGDARAATMQGVAGSIESAKELVRARWLAAGSTASGNLNIGNGVIVAVTALGYPAATTAGITAAITKPAAVFDNSTGGFFYGPDATTFANCRVNYTSTDVAAGATSVTASAANCGG